MTATPNAPPPTPASTAEQLREDAKFFRQRAQSIHGLMSANGDDDYQQDIDSYQRAAAALDAEAARMEAVTPTTDALDAAVESSRRLLVYVVENGTTPVALTYTELAGRIAALVAAVEARAVARERGRECA